MKNKRRLLLVDVSNQAWKAAASHPMLTDGEVFTGGLFGFINAVAKAIEKTDSTSICLCEDRKPYIRSSSYPEYKALRKGNKDPVMVEKVNTTVQQIRELCKITGWPIWSVQGFESDDLIAQATMMHRYRFDKITAMCNDSDLFQLFKYECFQTWKGKDGLYTFLDFYHEFGIMPAQLVPFLAITGTHNEVAGIKGVGPVGAKHALFNKDHMQNLRKLNAEVIDRNIGLIELPHKDFPRHEQMPLYTGAYDERALIRFCSQYMIQLQRWMSEAFEKVGK
jgi:DNA polymerase-1